MKKNYKNILNHSKSIIVAIVLFTIFGYFKLLHNSVIQICIFLTVLAVFLFEKTKKYIYLFLLLFVFIVNEIFYLLFGLDIFASHARTELNYSGAYLFDIFQSEQFNKIHPNLTEGLYPNCEYTHIDQAEINRFDKFMKLCNIEPGDSVLDAGCGNGDLVEYLRKKGVDAHGITITKYQYENNVKRYGSHYTHGDYTLQHNNLVNKFDHIILPGSLEHPFGGCVLDKKTVKNKFYKMIDMFKLFKKYYKKDSKKCNLLTTCIHTHDLEHELWNNKTNKLVMYCTERMFGGCYPTYGKYSVAEAMRHAGFKVYKDEDYTKAYYLSSYYSIEHFGNPADMGYGPLSLFWFYPIIIHSWLYWKYGMWMWMWSGHLHIRRDEDEKICDPNKSCDLFFENDFNKRPCSLLYTVSSCV